MQFSLFLFLLSQIIFIVGSVTYFLSSKEKNKTKKWLWYFVAVLVYVLLLIVVLIIWQKIHLKMNHKKSKTLYNETATAAAKDPNCKSDRQTCLETSIAIKKQNDLTRPSIIELENKYRTSPSSSLLELIQNTKKSIVNDQSLINECLKKSETNACIDKVIEACDAVVQNRGDPMLAEQYNAFKKTQGKSEILNFCKTLAQ